jgi:hypothetical protein
VIDGVPTFCNAGVVSARAERALVRLRDQVQNGRSVYAEAKGTA